MCFLLFSALTVGVDVFLGVRAGNVLGFWSSWLWSLPTRVGDVDVVLESGESVLLGVSLNGSNGSAADMNALYMSGNDSSNVSYAELVASMAEYTVIADCYEIEGCLNMWRNDSQCHVACNNSACNWDDGDCLIEGVFIIPKGDMPSPTVVDWATLVRRLSEGETF